MMARKGTGTKCIPEAPWPSLPQIISARLEHSSAYRRNRYLSPRLDSGGRDGSLNHFHNQSQHQTRIPAPRHNQSAAFPLNFMKPFDVRNKGLNFRAVGSWPPIPGSAV